MLILTMLWRLYGCMTTRRMDGLLMPDLPDASGFV
jgi:hypothetical protein